MKAEKPAIDPHSLPGQRGTGYPKEYAGKIVDRERRALGDAFGLTQFGVNMTHLPPGEISAQRHWHSSEDEFIYIIDGELTLVTDEGETLSGIIAEEDKDELNQPRLT